MGRISTYTQELADEIVARLSEGEPLRAICRDEHMPAWRTFYAWLAADTEFAARIARARELGHDALAEQCIDIADDERFDWLLTKKGVITNESAIGRAKLQVYTRMQLLAKWNPKRYGDKQQVEHSGEMTINGLAGRMRNRGPLA
jgi:hypothetical protein